MKKNQSLKAVQAAKSVEQLRREIKWLKRHIKIRAMIILIIAIVATFIVMELIRSSSR